MSVSLAPIILLCIFIAGLIINGYGLYLWLQWYKHFIIYKRFYEISLFIVAMFFIVQIPLLIEIFINDCKPLKMKGIKPIIFNLIPIEFVYMGTCAVIYRGYLVVLSWKHNKKLAKNMENTRIYYHKRLSSVILLSVMVISLVLLGIGSRFKKFLLLAMIAWANVLVLIIVLGAQIIYFKVKEGLGCYREMALIGLFIILNLVMGRIPVVRDLIIHKGGLSGEKPVIIMYQQMIQNIILIFITLYYPLYLIKKCENTLDYKLYEAFTLDVDKYLSKAPEMIAIETPHSDISIQTDINSITTSPSTQMIKLNEYLQSKQNYDYFMEYLGNCLSSESLIFASKIIVLNNVLKNIRNMDKTYIPDVDNLSDKMKEHTKSAHIYSIEFPYLDDIYSYYNELFTSHINSNDLNNSLTFENIKPVIYNIFYELYTNFISNDAPLQVNISYDAYSSIEYFFNDYKEKILNNDIESSVVNKLNNWDEIIVFWDIALHEVYRLLRSAYGFGFQLYLMKEMSK